MIRIQAGRRLRNLAKFHRPEHCAAISIQRDRFYDTALCSPIAPQFFLFFAPAFFSAPLALATGLVGLTSFLS